MSLGPIEILAALAGLSLLVAAAVHPGFGVSLLLISVYNPALVGLRTSTSQFSVAVTLGITVAVILGVLIPRRRNFEPLGPAPGFSRLELPPGAVVPQAYTMGRPQPKTWDLWVLTFLLVGVTWALVGLARGNDTRHVLGDFVQLAEIPLTFRRVR